MIAEVAAAYESLKAASTIARGMNSLNNQAEVNQAVIDIQRHLLDTQHLVMQLQDTVQELKSQIVELERFGSERFNLIDLVYQGHSYSGRKAYLETASGAFYCPGCFSNGKLTPIQFEPSGTDTHICKGCGTYLGTSDDYRSRF